MDHPLNRRAKPTKLLEGNIEISLHDLDLEFGSKFLDIHIHK
jgi:hypothetical protein